MPPRIHARLLLTGIILFGFALGLGPAASSAHAQAWTRTYGGPAADQIWDARPTSDGGFIVAAQTTSFGAGGFDLWVLKLSADGEIEWQAAYGGPMDEHAGSIEQRADGGYVLVGQSKSFGPGEPLWVLRLDLDGLIQQQQVIRMPNSNEVNRILVRRLSGGDLIVASQLGAIGDLDGWILRFDPVGNIVWQRRLELPGQDELLDVKEAADGTLLVGGYSSLGAGVYNHGWILRLDPAGAIVWQRGYEGPTSWGVVWSLQELPDGSLIAAGHAGPRSGGDLDFRVLRLSAVGDILWERTYRGPGDETGGFLIQTTGGVILSGLTSSFGAGGFDGLVLRLDDAGAIVRQAAFGGAAFDQVFASIPMPAGGYVAMGSTASFGVGGGDLWMLRFDASDNPGASCDIVGDSAIITADSRLIVVDTTAVMRDTNAVAVPTVGLRTVTDAVANLLCFGAVLELDADIKPGSCPNPLNLNRRGVIPVALTTFGPDDAALIDLGSVMLEGVPALRCSIDDVSAPFDSPDSCCGTPTSDGFRDVMCHFDSQAVAAALCATHAPPPIAGDTLDLTLTARTIDGVTLRASDCVRIQTFDCSTVPSPPGHRPPTRPSSIRPMHAPRR